MTKQAETKSNLNYRNYLDNGFVGLIDFMGSDRDIEWAARMSYGEETRPVSKTRGLIRYLWRKEHTSPFEMVELKFHLKMPIFVARQFIRHRTASVNEYSGRYSKMTDEFYLPKPERMQKQSQTNKQGSGDVLDRLIADAFTEQGGPIDEVYERAYGVYEELIDVGASRELSRIVLPVANYTEMVWKIDLKNLLHFIKLRLDQHAQYEIRLLAELIYGFVRKHFPLTTEAFEDYTLNGVKYSAQEHSIILELLEMADYREEDITNILEKSTLSKREKDEFIGKIKGAI